MPNLARGRASLASLTAVLLLSSSMTPVSLAVAQAATNPVDTAEWKAYANSAYGYCDADVLSKLWRIDIDSAKIRLGAKILAGAGPVIDRLLGQAFSRHSCQQGFNFEDAPKIADLWTAVPAA